MNQFLNIFTGIILSGALGQLNYDVLVDRGFVSNQKDKEEKRNITIIYSILDFLLFLLIFWLLSIFKLDFNLSLFLAVLMTSLIIISSMNKVIPFIYEFYFKHLNNFRLKTNLSGTSILSPRENAFESDKPVKAYVFDFFGDIVSVGFLKNYSENNELDHELLLQPSGLNDDYSKTEQEIIDVINFQEFHPDKDIKGTNIYIDSKNKLKYYLIYYSD